MGLQATRPTSAAMMPSRHARHLFLLSQIEAEDGVVALSMATTFPRIGSPCPPPSARDSLRRHKSIPADVLDPGRGVTTFNSENLRSLGTANCGQSFSELNIGFATGNMIEETGMNDKRQQTPVPETPPTSDQTANRPADKAGKRGSASAKTRKKNAGKPAAKAERSGTQMPGEALPDTAELSQQIAEVGQKSQQLVAEFIKRQTPETGVGMANSLAIGTAFLEMTA